jgi:predicted DNA-binding transcriptional regulator AlpA
MNDALLTPDEASIRLRKSKQTLANWRTQGGGPPYVRMGGRIVYRQSELTAWIAHHTYSCTSDYRKPPTQVKSCAVKAKLPLELANR